MQDKNISPLREFFHSKYVWIFLAVDVIAIILVAVIIANQVSKVSIINFNIAPVDATISVNGDTHYKNGQYDVKPGKYEISISHEGLETKTISIDLAARDYANVATFLKQSNDNFEFYELMENNQSYRKLKEIASEEDNITIDKDTSAQKFIANFEQKMSIMNALPIKGYVYADPTVNMSTGGFVIENGQSRKECKKSTCLVVRYHGKDYEGEVIKQIKKAGYDPNDYQLVYERYAK